MTRIVFWLILAFPVVLLLMLGFVYYYPSLDPFDNIKLLTTTLFMTYLTIMLIRFVLFLFYKKDTLAIFENFNMEFSFFGFVNLKTSYAFITLMLILAFSYYKVLSSERFYIDFSDDIPSNNVYCNKAESTEIVRILVLSGGNDDYVRVVRLAFINALLKLKPKKLCINFIERAGPLSYNKGDSIEYFHQINKCVNRHDKIDYFVSIGTSASKAISHYFRSSGGRTPDYSKKIIFLGVTFPVEEGLVSNLSGSRESDGEITGVRYSSDPIILPRVMTKLFPGKVIEFVYVPKYRQDSIMAKIFERSPDYIKGNFQINKLAKTPTISYLNSQGKAFFSWATFEDMYENNFDSLKPLNNIISTTSSHPYYKMAPYAISSSDIDIGTKGAQQVLTSYVKKKKLSEIPVLTPPWVLYFSKSVCSEKGLLIPTLEGLNSSQPHLEQDILLRPFE